MRTIRLRTKFLLSLVAISVGLTAATLLIVRYSVEQQVRASLREDLASSVRTYRSFARQRQTALSNSAILLANLPNVRALMTTQDPATIRDEAADIWKLSGSDLLVLADRAGKVEAVHADAVDLTRGIADELVQRSLQKQEESGWWMGGGHLYDVRIQPISFGPISQGVILGYLVIGDDVDESTAKDFSEIAASEVAIQSGNTLVTSTLSPTQKADWTRMLSAGHPTAENGREIELGGERYLATTVNLSASGEDAPVYLTVLKSLDQASAFVKQLNHFLLGLGFLSILLGSAMVFWISDTFTRPLANLVGGVRALEKGDFTYPLEPASGDEIAEVTASFGSMRSTLRKAQEEQRLLEERLRQAHKMEAVGRLAGGVAHDFNNLLTIIRGHSDLLIDRQGADDSYRRSLQQIQRASDRAVSMTRQLLAFSRMQVLQPRVLDLNAIVADMGKMLSRLIGEHIEYVFLPDAHLSPVKADPGQMEQVIMNLAVNARDAMPEGGKLTVHTCNVIFNDAQAALRPPMTSGEYVMLTVSDTGHGMDEKVKARIFDPFFTTKEVGKGTGLGLATVYGVVKQSGGFVWVQSAPGKGATFEIYLPQVAEKVDAVETQIKPSALPRGTETILLVEDEEGVRELARRFLTGSGYSVLEAGDGEQALEVAARFDGTIHLLLSDMVMPRMGGATLAKQLRAVRPDIKILLMSGYSEYSGSKSVSPDETVALQKPFSLISLVKKVREVLEGCSAEQDSGVSESLAI